MGAIAGARRTQSSFPTFLRSTNPSDLSAGTALFAPPLGFTTGYDAAVVHSIARLPEVARVRSYIALNAYPLGSDGTPTAAARNSQGFQVNGSVDGLYFTQDRVSVVRGRAADPRRPDEIMMTANAAATLGMHVGERVPWGVYTLAQAGTGTNQSYGVPEIRRTLSLVGIVVLNSDVVQDDVDMANSSFVILTPAFTSALIDCCSNFSFAFLQLHHHAADVAPVEAALKRILPPGLPADFYDPSLDTAKAVHAIKPEAIALGVFGAIAAAAALVIAGQMIGRQLRARGAEMSVLRSLGAARTDVLVDGLAGIVLAVVLGALVAGGVAVGLSPLFPLGPVRPVYPEPGVSFDLTVVGLGMLALVVLLVVVALLFGLRVTARQAGLPDYRAAASRIAERVGALGAPVPAATGVRLALEPGNEAVPARSASLGAVLAVVVLVATVVFGASLDALVSHPASYGWNWAYELNGGGGVGTVPAQRASALLGRDRQVAAWSSYYFATLQVDGHAVPVLGGSPGAAVAPPILSGHGFERSDQIVLGSATLGQLHRSVGDTVEVAFGTSPPTRLRIVGTATMPAIGIGGVSGHLSMGEGALADYRLIPPTVRNSFGNSPDGPNAIFVRLKPGVAVGAARASLQRIAGALSLPSNYGVTLVGVQHPAEIVNYRSMGSTPAALGGALAAGAVVALGLTLVASVRSRRRELALLKTLGFTRRQLASSVAWQSTIAVGLGVAVGVPLGIGLGRFLWTLFAHQIDVVPGPAVPAIAVTVIIVGALVLANLVAAVPGRIAAGTPTAVLLRAE